MKDEEASLDKVLKYWQLFVAIFLIIAGYLKLTFQVEQYASTTENWKKNSDTQRDRRNEEMEAVRTRLTRLESRLDCDKK